MGGVELIAAERERQIAEEGWTAEHDDGHDAGALADAAASYALTPERRQHRLQYDGRTSPILAFTASEFLWPWDDEDYKPTPDDRVRELVKAGALIAAEIDRIQRKDALK